MWWVPRRGTAWISLRSEGFELSDLAIFELRLGLYIYRSFQEGRNLSRHLLPALVKGGYHKWPNNILVCEFQSSHYEWPSIVGIYYLMQTYLMEGSTKHLVHIQKYLYLAY